MEYQRMSTADMLQYCEEALAWDQFGPVDIFFFESVKRILLGQCPAIEAPAAEELISYDKQAADMTQNIAEDIFYRESTEYTMTDKEVN